MRPRAHKCYTHMHTPSFISYTNASRSPRTTRLLEKACHRKVRGKTHFIGNDEEEPSLPKIKVLLMAPEK